MNKFFIIIPLVVAIVIFVFPLIAYSGNQIMVITSTSMLPVLYPNDLIIVEAVNVDEIKKDDIITFESHMDFGIVAHRVIDFHVEHGEILIITKGDNVYSPDPWQVSNDDLIGKVVKIIPKIGIIWTDNIRYLLVAVIAITVIFLIKESFESKTKNQIS